jgi:diphosphomevalonate decarboxylase
MLRESGIRGYFTVDAGPHVHVVCQQKDAGVIKSELQKIDGVKSIVNCGVGGPAKIIVEHIF